MTVAPLLSQLGDRGRADTAGGAGDRTSLARSAVDCGAHAGDRLALGGFSCLGGGAAVGDPARRRRCRTRASCGGSGRRSRATASCCGRCASVYQLAQPPSFQTVPSRSRWIFVVVCRPGRPRVTSTRGDALAAHPAQGGGDVVGLCLGHEDDRHVAEAGVRPEQQEQVREAGEGGAAEGLRAAARVLGDRDALAVADAVGDRQVGDVEAGAEDDRVDLELLAGGGDDRVRPDLDDAVGDSSQLGSAAPGSSRWRSGSACSRARSRGSPCGAARGR